METKKFYAFIISISPYRCGNYQSEDDWHEIIYDETMEGIIDKASKFCGYRGITAKDYYLELYTFECEYYNGQLYGKIMIPDYLNEDPEPMYNFDPCNNRLPAKAIFENYFPSNSTTNEKKDAFIKKILESDIYKAENKIHVEKVKFAEEERKRKCAEEVRNTELKVYAELKKKYADAVDRYENSVN